jgi:dTDP-4-amino-4,6-dideoxygalactose transaminase
VTRIPLVDLGAAHAEVAAEVRAGFERVIADTAFVGGTEVAAFEREYAAYCHTGHCVGVGNGTDALELALRAVGAAPGTEIVLPANSFIATAEAAARAGGRPVLVDCDPDTFLIDAQAALGAVTERTKAVVPVHLYGQLAATQRLSTALGGSGVRVVEDAAQSQGATVGAIAATSFYPGKNLGAYGDAGAVVTEDPDIAAAVRAMGNHGGTAKYRHDVLGFNSRLDGLQAAVLRAKLPRLRVWNEARAAAAARYDELLEGLDQVTRPTTLPGNEHAWHLYVIRVESLGGDAALRDNLVGKLSADGIGAGVHYPVPIHLTPAFAYLGYRAGAFPNAEAAAARILSLPLHPHITADEQAQVVEALRTALG